MNGIDDLLPILGFENTSDLIAGLKAYFLQQQYVWKDEQIIGFRMDDTYTDTCSDWFVIMNGGNVVAVQGSTKPGSYWLNLKTGGTLKEGQIIGMWVVGKTDWSRLPYLQEVQPSTCYRDHSLLGTIDRAAPQATGQWGCNFHSWANIGENQHVGNLSEMCMVTDPAENTAAFAVINTMTEPINFTLIFTSAFLS